jgi:hypothetical protein
MTRGRDYTGPSWQQPSWYLRRIDRHHRLGHRETVEAAIEACRRTRDAAATHPAADPYELARQAIAHVRHEHEIDDREPIPNPHRSTSTPFSPQTDPRTRAARRDPMQPTPTGARDG